MTHSDLRFDGKVALVTGGGRGLGKAYARLLAARGARVAINNRSADAAYSTVEEIREAGGEAVAIVGDLANPEIAHDCIERTTAAYGGIDILINNAGGVARLGAFAELAPEDRDDTLRQNVISAWDITRAAWRHIVARRGRIVFTTSPAFYGSAQAPHYATSKAGVVALARSLAIDGAASGVHVNAISPVAATPAAAALAADDAQRAFFATHFPVETCAAVVAWLAHAGCTLNGEVLSVAGARVARIFLAESEGYSATVASFTPEAIAAQLEAAMRTDSSTVYRNSDEVMTDLVRRALERGA